MKLSVCEQQLHISIQEPTDCDHVLEDLHLSRKSRYLLYQERRILRNGQVVSRSMSLGREDQLVLLPTPVDEPIPIWDHPIDILYEDEVLLIVNKEPQMLVHSDGNNTSHTLCNCVAGYYARTHQDHPIRPLHRLDVETSGILLFCKCPLLQPLFDDRMKNKQIHRSYLAIVQGRFPKRAQLYTDPIGRDRHDARRYITHPKGKPAQTSVSLVHYDPQHDRSLIRCRLFTGRTHQIRVHLASHGFPLLNDPLYGKKSRGNGRLALHSASVSLQHPLSEKPLVIECPLPQDLRLLLE